MIAPLRWAANRSGAPFASPRSRLLHFQRDLRKFVEESELSLPKIANLMGDFSATLSMWTAGTAKPSGANLLLIKRFLERRDFSQTGLSSDLT